MLGEWVWNICGSTVENGVLEPVCLAVVHEVEAKLVRGATRWRVWALAPGPGSQFWWYRSFPLDLCAVLPAFNHA